MPEWLQTLLQKEEGGRKHRPRGRTGRTTHEEAGEKTTPPEAERKRQDNTRGDCGTTPKMDGKGMRHTTQSSTTQQEEWIRLFYYTSTSASTSTSTATSTSTFVMWLLWGFTPRLLWSPYLAAASSLLGAAVVWSVVWLFGWLVGWMGWLGWRVGVVVRCVFVSWLCVG